MREKLFTLNGTQRDALERRYKQTHERRVSERIQALLLLDAGHNRDQVARILRVSTKTIMRWVRLFVTAGIDTLCTLPAGNTDAALTSTEQRDFAAWLDSEVRSTKEAIDWVAQTFQLHYSPSGMRTLLQRMGYSFKQPAQRPAQADPDAQAAWLISYAEKRGS